MSGRNREAYEMGRVGLSLLIQRKNSDGALQERDGLYPARTGILRGSSMSHNPRAARFISGHYVKDSSPPTYILVANESGHPRHRSVRNIFKIAKGCRGKDPKITPRVYR